LDSRAAGDSTLPVLHLQHPVAACGRQLVRAAAAWLRAHLTENLTVGDLCRALNARERTLHAAFCDHLGTSPKAYFKQLRLTAVRSELLRAQRGTRVTDVALRWGFLHLGWFSHDYGHHFGETPSATLRRSQERRSATRSRPRLRRMIRGLVHSP
jgi:AraC family transcriptional regulator, ethanolamine operon transcriptional activator